MPVLHGKHAHVLPCIKRVWVTTSSFSSGFMQGLFIHTTCQGVKRVDRQVYRCGSLPHFSNTIHTMLARLISLAFATLTHSHGTLLD